MSHLVLRGALLALAAFVAVTALFGAFTVVPGLPPEWLDGSVFPDYTVPAIGLAVVGAAALVAAFAIVVRPEVAGLVSVLAGTMLAVFEFVEIASVGLSIAEHGTDEPVAWLQVVYLVVGLAQMALGFALWRRTRPDRDRRMRTGHHLLGTHA